AENCLRVRGAFPRRMAAPSHPEPCIHWQAVITCARSAPNVEPSKSSRVFGGMTPAPCTSTSPDTFPHSPSAEVVTPSRGSPRSAKGGRAPAVACSPQRVGGEGDDRVSEIDAEVAVRIHAAAALERITHRHHRAGTDQRVLIHGLEPEGEDAASGAGLGHEDGRQVGEERWPDAEKERTLDIRRTRDPKPAR